MKRAAALVVAGLIFLGLMALFCSGFLGGETPPTTEPREAEPTIFVEFTTPQPTVQFATATPENETQPVDEKVSVKPKSQRLEFSSDKHPKPGHLVTLTYFDSSTDRGSVTDKKGQIYEVKCLDPELPEPTVGNTYIVKKNGRLELNE